MKNIFDWIASLFVKDNYDPDDPFPNFDEKQIALNLDVVNEAQRHGLKNVPAENDSQLSGTEQLIKSEFTQRYHACHNNVRKKIGGLTTEILASEFDEFVEKLNFRPDQIKANFEKVSKEGRIDVNENQSEVDNLQKDFDSFKRSNRLTHFPDYPDSRILGLGILSIIVVIETIMNGYFFAKGSELGLLGGVLQAFVISAVNVMIAFIAGNYLFRWIFHRRPAIRISGVILFVFYLIFLFSFVFAITHYRDAFTLYPDNAWKSAELKVMTLSLSFKDIDSFIFLLFSLIFALFAFIDAFKLDDYYPRYGKIHRRLVQAKEALADEKANKREELEQVKSLADYEIESIKESVRERKANLNIAGQAVTGLIQNYEKYMKSLQQGGIAVIKEYQTNNKLHRSTPMPKYFNETPDLDYSKFALEPIAVSDFSEELDKLDDFYSKLERQLVVQTTMYTSFLSQFADSNGQEH